MKKRKVILLALIAVLVLFAGSTTALALYNRRITGHVGFFVPEWGPPSNPGVAISMYYDVRELGKSGRARGQVSWMIYHEDMGWRHVDSRPICVVFGEHEGKSAAVFVARIVNKVGWGPGEPGEYAYYWVRDGGTPGSEGDQWGSKSYQYDPFIEFWPADDPPPCEYYVPDHPPQPIDVQGGDLVIRH
jgi:hypothetical protein